MSMKSDPVIDGVREVRHRISSKFDHDPYRIVEYYAELEKELTKESATRESKSRKGKS